ncbi:DVU_1553 family AMP-dependent CoA ligase [Lacrimispora amygdalina]|uniref:DVU_1553 family AMP-dependent CoA ligase n=1 Tax=Lacrimispora amygdalina TaxID=253257 RepID=UPI000BE42948|nr:AMP-binding protein [Lacrimispora amygdalina]
MKLTPLEPWILEKTGIHEKSRVALEEYQIKQLVETLHYAKDKSRYYKRKLEKFNIDSIKTISDFHTIPFTYPEDIKKKSTDFLCVSEKEIKRIVTLNTSGTSGEEKRIYFTEEDLNQTIDFFQYGMKCLTDSTDRVLVLLPGRAYGSIGDLLKKALALSDIDCIVHGVLKNPDEVEQIIIENNISCIVGIPMQILYLSRLKGEIFGKYIKKVLLSTDYVPDVLIRELECRFQCAVFNHYGMTEMGYGGGVECQALAGYHLREGDLYFEIIDPITGEPVEDGQYGEVVFTTFRRQAMPLIRYRTGDRARFSPNLCSCKTFLRTMDKVTGRLTNKVIFSNSQEIQLRDLDEIILKYGEVLDYTASYSETDTLLICLTLINGDTFVKLQEEIMEQIHSGWNVNVFMAWKPDSRTLNITNSMRKRSMIKLQKGGGKDG